MDDETQKALSEAISKLLPGTIDDVKRAVSKQLSEILPGVELDVEVRLSNDREILITATRKF